MMASVFYCVKLLRSLAVAVTLSHRMVLYARRDADDELHSVQPIRLLLVHLRQVVKHFYGCNLFKKLNYTDIWLGKR